MSIMDLMRKDSSDNSGGFYKDPAPKDGPVVAPAIAAADVVRDKVEFAPRPTTPVAPSASASFEAAANTAQSSIEKLLAETISGGPQTNKEDVVMNNQDFNTSESVAAPISAPISAPVTYSAPAPAPVPKREESSAISRITRDTTISGSIISETDLEVLGTIMGDIESKLFVSLTGKVYGNVSAKNAELDGAAISGNVYVAEDLKLLGGTILVGDIYAQSTEIDGKIKGNISVSDRVKIKNGAYIIGDITSKNISVEPGAIVQGRISIESYATGQDIEQKFEELQKLALPSLQGAKPVTPPPARVFTPATVPAPVEPFVPAPSLEIPVIMPEPEETVAAPVSAPVVASVKVEAPVSEPESKPVAEDVSSSILAAFADSPSAKVEESVADEDASEAEEALEAEPKVEEKKEESSISEEEAKAAKLKNALADLKKRSK